MTERTGETRSESASRRWEEATKTQPRPGLRVRPAAEQPGAQKPPAHTHLAQPGDGGLLDGLLAQEVVVLGLVKRQLGQLGLTGGPRHHIEHGQNNGQNRFRFGRGDGGGRGRENARQRGEGGRTQGGGRGRENPRQRAESE